MKAAIIMTDTDYKVIKALENNVPKIMRQTIPLEPFGACTTHNNYAFSLIDGTMGNLTQAGIPQFLFRYLMEFELRSLEDPPNEPSVFSVRDLEFGFVTWLIACGIAILAFVGELIWKKITTVFWNHVGMFYFYKLLRQFLK